MVLSPIMNDPLEQLVELARKSRLITAFTGAGISTESGIPDFRSPGGVWSRYRPVTFPEFLESGDAREEYWRRYVEMYPSFAEVRPNPGHQALAELERRGRLLGVITQNIDRLHQAAGNSEDRVVELHGRIDRTECLDCGQWIDTGQAVARVEAGEKIPVCEHCGGWLKPATISFGQNLPEEALTRAVELTIQADLFIAVGSSLTVQPAASLPPLATRHQADLVIINNTSTPYDSQARLVINQGAGSVLSALIERLDRPA